MLVLSVLVLVLCTVLPPRGVLGAGRDTGVSMDYKTYLPAGKLDCYYQYGDEGDVFHVGFQVIDGGDGHIGFEIKHPNGTSIFPYYWGYETDYEWFCNDPGYYEICLDNQRSQMGFKLVNVFINLFKQKQWGKYTDEINEMHLTVVNFTAAISGIESQTQKMFFHLLRSRVQEARDYALLTSNLSTITYMSLLHCFLVVITAVLQILFVRAIFSSK